jgi:hypothetical protein
MIFFSLVKVMTQQQLELMLRCLNNVCHNSHMLNHPIKAHHQYSNLKILAPQLMKAHRQLLVLHKLSIDKHMYMMLQIDLTFLHQKHKFYQQEEQLVKILLSPKCLHLM